MKQNYILHTLLILLAWTFSLAGFAEEPLQWSVDPTRNMLLEVENLPDKIGPENEIWSVESKARMMYSQPVLHQGKIIFGGGKGLLTDPVLSKVQTRSSLVCIEAATGKRLWEMPMGYNPYGLCSTAVPDGDRLYIVTASGNMMCLDLNGMADGNDGEYQDELSYFAQRSDPLSGDVQANWGDVIWFYDMKKEQNVTWHDAPSATPLLIGDQIWVATSQSYHTNHPRYEEGFLREIWQWAPNILVFDKASGRVIAKDNIVIPQIYHGQWSSLSYTEYEGKQYVVFGDGAGFVRLFDVASAVDPEKPDEVQTLTEVWRYNVNPPEELDVPYPTWRDVYAGTDEAKERLANGPCEIITSPLTDGKYIYAVLGRDYNYCKKEEKRAYGSSRLVCLDLTSTKTIIHKKFEIQDLVEEGVVWSTRDVGRTMASMALEDGLLYVADIKGFMHCFDAKTGEKYWEHDVGSKVWSTSPLLADGKIYVATAEREFYILKAGKEKEVLFQADMEPGLATATAEDGILYLLGARGLAAYRGK